jgi:hypothetical protein
MFRSLGRRSRLSASDWRLLAGATLLQILTALALRIVSLPLLRAMTARWRPLAVFLLQGTDERVIWAVEASGRRLARFSTCLVRAIVVDLRLSSAERPLRLTIGIRRTPPGDLKAHAWLEDRRQVLIGGPLTDEFVPLVAWDSLVA